MKMFIAFLSLFLLVGHSGAWAASSQLVTVGPTGDYGSLATALAQANIGDGTQESERDTIIIQNGSYPAGDPMGDRVAVSDKNYVTIGAETDGSVTITPNSGELIKWENSHNVILEGFSTVGGNGFGLFYFNHDFLIKNCGATNSSTKGIRFGGDAAFTARAAGYSIQIINCNFSNNGSLSDGGHTGISIRNTGTADWSQRFIIDGCKLNGNGEDGIQTGGALDNSHADEDHIAAYIEIKNCEIKDNGENGVDLKASRYIRVHHNVISGNTVPGIIIHSPENTGAAGNTGTFKCAIYNNLIRDNGFHGIGTGDGDYAEKTNNLFFNNLIIGNNGAGIYAAADLNVGGDYIFNNTILETTGNGTTSNYYGGWGVAYPETVNVNHVINNIIFDNANPGIKAVYVFDKLNNILDDDGQNWADNLYTADVKFTDQTNQDYHLSYESPARNYPYAGQIFTTAQVNEYKTFLGSDLPIQEYGATIDYDDLPRSKNFPGALEGLPSPNISSVIIR